MTAPKRNRGTMATAPNGAGVSMTSGTLLSSDTVRMDAATYIEERLDDQLSWHDRKSGRMQTWFTRLRASEMLLAASIPVVSLIEAIPADVRAMSSACIGAVLTIIAGFLHLQQYEKLWLRYRATAESLGREKFLFLTRTAHYAGKDAFPRFVERVEKILDEQNSQWESTQEQRSESADQHRSDNPEPSPQTHTKSSPRGSATPTTSSN